MKKHPKRKRALFPWAIPLGLHGDAGAFSDNDSLYALSWNSLMGSGSTITKRFIFTVIKKSDMVADTLDQIFKIFGWSCNAMLAGETPDFDWNGKAIAGGGVKLAGGGVVEMALTPPLDGSRSKALVATQGNNRP